ncbi:hypothetical protein HYD87_02500 [Mycoplasmopsis bovis]|nr:hypothetical protein [Mycoplasmopsis bovis]QQH36663.1 hypothetical protein HYD87_02500 [Mycoplasmopsis bovis]
MLKKLVMAILFTIDFHFAKYVKTKVKLDINNNDGHGKFQWLLATNEFEFDVQ